MHESIGFKQALNTSVKVAELRTYAVLAVRTALTWQSQEVFASKLFILVERDT
jgi:hypothetical protein